MDEGMQVWSSQVSVDSATQFDRYLKEQRDLSSQLRHVADYCETAFRSSQDERLIVQTTKDYVSQAVFTVIDHLGSISAILEYTITKSNSIPETENKIDGLKQRIGTFQQYSHELALARFQWRAEFSRYQCRYILLPSEDSAMRSSASRDSASGNGAASEEGNQIQTKEEPHLSDTRNCRKYLIERLNNEMEKKNGVSPTVSTNRDYKYLLPVHGGLSTLPKPKHSNFQFQMARKLKRGMMKLKLAQNKDIAALVRRGRRMLA